MVLKSWKVVGKVVVKVLRVVRIARILRGLRLAARLKLSLSEEIEIAVHKLPSSIMKLEKSRLMMEVNYMLSYGAAEPSLFLLQRYNILGMLLPFHASHLAQQSNKQLSESSVMLMKLFSSLDQLVPCGRPSHDSLWVALLAFHLALIANPQKAYVILTFASLLYHLAVLVQNSLDISPDKDNLQEAMSRFPDMPLDFLDLSSPDASNAQVVRGKILSNFSGPVHASVHEKDQCGGPNLIDGRHNSTGSRLK
ncbi:hypothetical protein CQW23_29031 [Capsicum baccatum]|uniref:tRNA nucleotidyltransferase/poly(A) polymerase RNA and SrmB- binding domain-containing protein n=1 Tax=Capsicum baccatum TaxID=33114 RepID=A0A2G2VI91_CAPBA|nr:hypothetical protein CQW23_29031 [Capsicum baccatum]